jgi:hypothetical protein
MRKALLMLLITSVGASQLALKSVSASEYIKQLSLAYTEKSKSAEASLKQMENRISKDQADAIFSYSWDPYFKKMSEAQWKSLFERLKKRGAIPHLKFVHNNFASQMNEYYPHLYSKDPKNTYRLRAEEKQEKLVSVMKGLYSSGYKLSEQLNNGKACEYIVDFIASEKMIELMQKKDQLGAIASKCDKEISRYLNKMSGRIPLQAQNTFNKLKPGKVSAKP